MNPRRKIAIVITLLFLILAYLIFRLIFPLTPSPILRGVGAFILTGGFCLVLWLPLFFWNREEAEVSAGLQILVNFCFFSMAGLSFLLTGTLIKDLLWVLSLGNWKWLETISAAQGVLLFSILGLGVGTLNALFGLKTVRKEIQIKDLPESLQNLTIAQISDLHIGNTVQASYVKRVVRNVNELHPDLIVLTGDIVDGMVLQLRPRFELLSGLHSKFGSFYVTGNHEFYWEANAWIAEARRIGFTALDNENKNLVIEKEQISICGVSDEMPDFSKASQGTESSALKILLCHQPHHAKRAQNFGFDLQLSGHTHGGQFFPWTWVIHFIQPYVQGLYRVGKMWLYINRGTGHWGPPVRLGTAPEITYLKLVRV